MDKIELVQIIGRDICEDCGPERDCGLEYEDCDRIAVALSVLEDYIDKQR